MTKTDKIKYQAQHLIRNYEGSQLLRKVIEFAENWYMQGNEDCFKRLMRINTENPESK